MGHLKIASKHHFYTIASSLYQNIEWDATNSGKWKCFHQLMKANLKSSIFHKLSNFMFPPFMNLQDSKWTNEN